MEAIFSLTFKLMSILFIFCRERGVGTVLCMCLCVCRGNCVCVCVCRGNCVYVCPLGCGVKLS